jgi:hypothetical protein
MQKPGTNTLPWTQEDTAQGPTRVETDNHLPVPGEQGWCEQKAKALGPSA